MRLKMLYLKEESFFYLEVRISISGSIASHFVVLKKKSNMDSETVKKI